MSKTLFQGRHYYWLATKLPWLMYKAGLSIEQMGKVINLLDQELVETNPLYKPEKFRRVVEETIRKVKEANDG